MSQTARTPEAAVADETTARGNWRGAAGDGIVAGIVMGVLMAALMPGALDAAIPALYGLEGGFVGVTAHLAHAAVLGVVFAAVVRFGNLERFADSAGTSAGLGLAYGVVLWVVTGSVVLPAWLGAVGFAGAPPVPTFDTTSLLTHAAYGVVLGALYPSLKRY
jgi:hypothetical protein